MNNELQGIWKEAVLAQFEVLPGETHENHEKFARIAGFRTRYEPGTSQI
jgi:hypothetical protein